MSFTYWLPDENGNKQTHSTNRNSVIIIGANGSGKSKLGAWIERQDMKNVHRIGAQRDINLEENIPLKNYREAVDSFLFGTPIEAHQESKIFRWGEDKYNTTKLLNDFNDVVAALISLTNNDNNKFAFECSKISDRNSWPTPPITATHKLIRIWDDIFPQRKLELLDSKFLASPRNNIEHKYNARQMSDGERSVLYIVAQVLCVPKNKYLIIDEPELHLHRSIMNRLWSNLEKFRPDCFFIYITHDTFFAASHSDSDKIWVKDYNDEKWNIEVLQDHNLPEDLLFEILGSRKNVLFVEGEMNSYDTKLYRLLYPNFHVVPCGSCFQVISRTKAFRNVETLHHFSVYGIIDRDFRSPREIEKYKEDNIYVLAVAEIENLFLTEEIVRFVAEYLRKDPNTVFNDVKNHILARFKLQLEHQICKSIVANLKFQLSSIELSQKNEEATKNSFNAGILQIDFEKTKAQQRKIYSAALASEDYDHILRIFNEKGLSKAVGQYFGLQNNCYCDIILSLLKEDGHSYIKKELQKYIPLNIPENMESDN